jgi:hypothetical protein
VSLKIKVPGQIPYGGGWSYVDPNGGQSFFYSRFDLLVDKVREYRRANNFPIGLGFEKEIEEQICLNHPDECESDDPRMPRRKQLGVSDIIRGSRVMLSFYQAGKPLVSREEAERRAQICMKCNFNAEFSRPCSGLCGELKDVVGVILNHTGTQYDPHLKSCHVCACFNAAQIWVPWEILDKGLTPEMREQFELVPRCWKKPSLNTPQ